MQHMRRYHGTVLKRSQGSLFREQKVIDCSTFTDAANTGRVDVLEYCLRAGLDINLKADDGFTALHCAARLDQVEALKVSSSARDEYRYLRRQWQHKSSHS